MPTAAVSSWKYKNDFFSISIHESERRPGATSSRAASASQVQPHHLGQDRDLLERRIQRPAAASGRCLLLCSPAGNRDKERRYPLRPERRTRARLVPGSDLLIEDASPEAIREILEFSARDLVQTVMTACHPDVSVPAGPLDPEAMQRFLESVGIPNYREMAPPPIANRRPPERT